MGALENISQRFASAMIEKLSIISADYKTPWISKNGNMIPRNLIGRNYNGVNYFMLSILCDLMNYQLPIFMTFNQAKEFNVNILKDSKAFPICYYNYIVRDIITGSNILFEEYILLSNDEKKQYEVKSYLHNYFVFNIHQTNYSEVYPDKWNDLISSNNEDRILYNFETLDTLIENQSWICPIYTGFDKAYYSFSDKICIPAKIQFKEESFYYTVLLHEMAHSTGTSDRLNRNNFYEKDIISYGREELVAELTAAFVAAIIGINSSIKNENVSYLKNWINKIKEEPNYLFSILTDVNKNASYILNIIDINLNEAAA